MTKLKKRSSFPKQWLHWCAQMNLTPSESILKRKKSHLYYLRGRGRHWRLNCNNRLDVGSTYAEFDRWSRSCIDTVPMTAKTFTEFKGLVLSLETSALNSLGEQ